MRLRLPGSRENAKSSAYPHKEPNVATGRDR